VPQPSKEQAGALRVVFIHENQKPEREGGEHMMSRYKKEHSYEDVGIPFLWPMIAKKTEITDTETGRQAKGYDWSSFGKSDREAFDKLKKNNR
jgi:hypothetical protein